MNPVDCTKTSFQNIENCTKVLKQLSRWFKSQFSVLSPEAIDLDPTTGTQSPIDMVGTLKTRVEQRVGLPDELCAIFASLLKTLGVDVRIVRY